MPSPSSSLSTLRPDLATFFEYDLESDRAGYIASKVFPVVEVASQSGTYGKIPLEELLEERDTKRAPGAGFSRSQFTFTPQTYACMQHGAEEPVDDRERNAYSEYFQSEMIATARAYGAVLRNAEKRVADTLFNATTFSSYTTALTNEWDSNHKTNATPIQDVENAVQSIYNQSGLWANALIVNRKVFRNLRNLDEIKDRINSAGAGDASKPSDISAEMLARVFDLDYVFVAGASRNSANEGQSASPTQIWSDEYAMVCKVATSSDMKEACIGRTFHWGQNGSTIGGTVEQYREEKTTSDIYRVRHDVDEVLLYAEAGHLLSNVTT